MTEEEGQRRGAWEERRGKQKAGDSNDSTTGNKDHHGKSLKMKLSLNQKLATTLVTQHHLSQNEADSLFDKCYNEAEAF